MHNRWGCLLVPSKGNDLRVSPTNNSNDKSMDHLNDAINNHFKDKYQLVRVLTCGSDANLHAVFIETGGNTNLCLSAAGSYISGDMGPVMTWSTSSLSITDKNVCSITPPKC